MCSFLSSPVSLIVTPWPASWAMRFRLCYFEFPLFIWTVGDAWSASSSTSWEVFGQHWDLQRHAFHVGHYSFADHYTRPAILLYASFLDVTKRLLVCTPGIRQCIITQFLYIVLKFVDGVFQVVVANFQVLLLERNTLINMLYI